MDKISTIGLDLAKSVFQVHGIDAAGQVLVRRQLRRAEVVAFFAELPPCLVGMEACATAHHWGRELIKLGHTVRLMPPAYVKPYVKRGQDRCGGRRGDRRGGDPPDDALRCRQDASSSRPC